MDKYTIGVNAGIVWHLLNNGQVWEYDQLKAASGLPDRELNAAIGWLAREDKIVIEPESEANKERFRLMLNVYI